MRKYFLPTRKTETEVKESTKLLIGWTQEGLRLGLHKLCRKIADANYGIKPKRRPRPKTAIISEAAKRKMREKK